MTELEKCKKDPKHFIEKYCLVNGKKYKLKDYQIVMLNLFDNCDILKLQHHIIDCWYNKVFRNKMKRNLCMYQNL